MALYLVSPKPFLMIYIFWNKPVLSRYRITVALATQLKIPKSLDGRLMLRSFSRKFQPKTDLGLRFEVAQSVIPVGWTKQTVACHLPFTAFKSCAFYIRAFFYNIQTVHFSGALKKVAYMPRSGGKYPRKRTAQYGLLSVFL